MKTALLAALMTCSGCSDSCQNTVVSRSLSPDGKHVAVLFQRDCGVSTSFSTHISILNAGNNPVGSGNIFIADDNHGAARVGSWDGPWAEATWLSADRILVLYVAESRLFRQNKRVSDVRVLYQGAGS
jgi:hypothetical protein